MRDEEEHVAQNMKIFLGELENFSKEDKLEIIAYVKKVTKSFVEAEHLFLDLVYEVGDQEGTSKEDMKNYITYLANLRMKQMGWKPVFEEVNNPLTWMDWVLSGKKHTNFFEERVTDYSHDPLKGSIDYEGYKLNESEHQIPVVNKKPKQKLTVYSTGWCSYCNKLKQMLDYNLIDYEVIDVDKLETFDYKTIPQVFEGDIHLGGYTETVNHFCGGQ